MHIPSEASALSASALDDAKLRLRLATCFGLVLVLGGACGVAILRHYLGSDSYPIGPLGYLRAVLLGLALVLCPWVFRGRLGLGNFGVMAAALLGLAFLPAPVVPVLDLGALLLTAAGGVAFLRGIRRGEGPALLSFAALGAVMAAALFGIVAALNYSTPIALELTMLGLNHHDTIFHVAVAQSLYEYGIASIGVDGLVPLSYHVFSHRVNGGFAGWLGIELFHGYALFLATVAVPVMLALLLQTAAQLTLAARGAQPPAPSLLLVLAVLLFGGALAWHSYYASESYTLSLWMLLAAVILMQRLFGAEDRREAPFLLAALVLALTLAALSKISVGAVLGCAVAAGIAAQGGFRPRHLLLGAAVGLLPFVAVYLASPVTQVEDAPLFRPFGFVMNYERPAIYALLFALVVGFLAWRNLPPPGPRRALAIALVTGMWAGLVSSYLLNLAGGAEYYFANPGSWLGLLLVPLLGLYPRWLARRDAGTQVAVLGGLVLLFLFAHDRHMRSVERLTAAHAAFAALPPVPDQGLGERAVRGTEVGRLLTEARAAGRDHDGILVSPDERGFWTSQPVCWSVSLVLPALVGRPMLTGVVPAEVDCEVSAFYGFADYELEESRARAVGTEEVCALARSRGMERILRLAPDASSVIDCRL